MENLFIPKHLKAHAEHIRHIESIVKYFDLEISTREISFDEEDFDCLRINERGFRMFADGLLIDRIQMYFSEQGLGWEFLHYDEHDEDRGHRFWINLIIK